MKNLPASGSSHEKNNDVVGIIVKSLQSSNDAVSESNKALSEIMIYIEKRFSEQENKIEKIQEKQAHSDIENNPHYATQNAIGKMFSVPIGAQYMGKLLVAVGIARKIEGSTVPYQGYLESELARSYISRSGHQHYMYHSERTIKHITKWLKNNDLYDEFVSITEIEDMKYFIGSI